MPTYRIHRLKENPRQSFRLAPHTAGSASVKPKDYDPSGEVTAQSPYSAWAQLQGSGQALEVGDLLEDEAGALRIFKFVGFEEAKWVLPEVKPGSEGSLPAATLPFAMRAQ